jgi:hypothetical protein
LWIPRPLFYGGPPQGKMSSGRLVSSKLGGPIASRTWTFVGSCTSTSSSLNFGSLSAGSIQADDLAVFIDLAGNQDFSPATAVTPSGFTNRINTAGAFWRGMLSEKKLTGSEGSVSGMSVTGSSVFKIGFVFRYNTAYSTITASTPTTQMTNADPSSQSISPASETSPVVLIGVTASNGSNPDFSTESPAFDAKVLVTSLRAGRKIYNSSPSNHTIDMNDLGSNNWLAGIYYTVS